MAEIRDYKRRRQTYRGKNKENRKMTGLEVSRHFLIFLQCDSYLLIHSNFIFALLKKKYIYYFIFLSSFE